MLVKLDVVRTEENYDDTYPPRISEHVELESRKRGELIELRFGGERRFVWVRSGELLGAVEALCKVKDWEG